MEEAYQLAIDSAAVERAKANLEADFGKPVVIEATMRTAVEASSIAEFLRSAPDQIKEMRGIGAEYWACDVLTDGKICIRWRLDEYENALVVSKVE